MRTTLIAALAGLAGMPLHAGTVWFGTQSRAGSEGIHVAQFDPANGRLSGLRVAARLGGAGFQALAPDGKSLYSTCAVDGGGGVAALRVNPDGTLTELNRRPTGGSGACFVGIDATGRCVLAANYGDGSVASFPVAADGSLATGGSVHRHAGKGPDQARQDGPHAHSIQPGPDNRFAYAPDLGIDKVVVYQLDAARGTLAPAGAAELPPGSGPRHMKFGAGGRFAYVLNELALTVAVFERAAAGGGLARRAVVPVLPEGADPAGITCSEIRISADGRHLYTANRDTARRGRDSISVLAIDDHGAPTRIQTVPAAVSIPRHITLDPSGRWLLVCGEQSNEVAVLAVDAGGGKLGALAGKLPLGTPMCATFAGPLP